MAESITISSTPPEFKSMQYDLLRQEGLRRIQELAGKIWTNYNASDPGVSILEVLSYAITDLGYRASYPIQDILAKDPDDPQEQQLEIKNFYTARQILPVNPVTIDDFRKLLIDCEVYDSGSSGCPSVGVRNAWIEMATENEVPVFLNDGLKTLDYVPANPNEPIRIIPGVLYNVLLELGECTLYGDMNDTTQEAYITISPCSAPNALPTELIGIKIKVMVEFPRWDDENVDWEDQESIKNHVKRIVLNFPNLADPYELDGYGLDGNKNAYVNIIQITSPTQTTTVKTTCIETQINNLIYTGTDSLIALYQSKVKKIHEITAEARKVLMSHRNLCEDAFKISALKVEEVALCADIEVNSSAHIEEIEAKIYFELDKFISPRVNFHDLNEMFSRGYTSDQIFDGPALNHGFIDSRELQSASRRKVINVSDLISIIMDIPGVVAVKKIQIANVPEDNDDNIISQAVKWQLKLAYDKNYVPRLNPDISKVTFYKGPLPFVSNEVEVDQILSSLKENSPKQKLTDAVIDIDVPEGEHKHLDNYVSLQDEFPEVYGIGPAGLSANASDSRKVQAKQLKGFLLFYDQLLANYLTQLKGVKQLFSMNAESDANGNMLVSKSYFTQSLFPYMSDAGDLLPVNGSYEINIQNYTESETLFEDRRNRFLDHLMARFSEQFTDYAMLVYRVNGKKAPASLVTDKLAFLNAYPKISGERFRAMNYENQGALWTTDNVSGFEERVALLNGVDARAASTLNYSTNVRYISLNTITDVCTGFEILDDQSSIILTNQTETRPSLDEWKLWLEQVLLHGVHREYFQVLSSGQPVTAITTGGSYSYRLIDKDQNILGYSDPGISPYLGFSVESAITKAINTITTEFVNNPEANRMNLAAPIENYFDEGTITIDMTVDPPEFDFNFTLYKNPFDFTNSNTTLLTGNYTGYGTPKSAAKIISVVGNNIVRLDGDYYQAINPSNNAANIKDSSNNNGAYTILSRANVSGKTEVTLNTSALSNSGLPGVFYFNTQTQNDLSDLAGANLQELLFEVAYNGTHADNYKLAVNQSTSDYEFSILDRCKNVLATSTEVNFNDTCASFIDSVIGSVTISGNTSNNNDTYNTSAVIAEAGIIKVDVNTILDPLPGGELSFDVALNVGTYTAGQQFIKVTGTLLNRILFPGDRISLQSTGWVGNTNFTVERVTDLGGSSRIYVKEKFIGGSFSSATLTCIKSAPITNIENDTASGHSFISIPFGAGQQAIAEMVEFINSKFFGHEGLHLVENILLRPKNKDMAYVPMIQGENAIAYQSAPFDNAVYTKFYNVSSADNATLENCFILSGNVAAEFVNAQTVIIKGSSAAVNDNTYTINGTVTYVSGVGTKVKVNQAIPSMSLSNNGKLYFNKNKSLSNLTAFTFQIAEDATSISDDYPVILAKTGVTGSATYFKIKTISGSNPSTITLNEVRTQIHDNFLPLNIDTGCGDCKITDPYSFVGSVIMPYWQGRFIDQDFRGFFERTIRTECPAHIALSVCWINNKQMQLFETRYKTWLIENSKLVKDQRKHSMALNNLIEILGELRSVYPKGTLHDCETDSKFNNAIVLNKTVIGTLQL